MTTYKYLYYICLITNLFRPHGLRHMLTFLPLHAPIAPLGGVNCVFERLLLNNGSTYLTHDLSKKKKSLRRKKNQPLCWGTPYLHMLQPRFINPTTAAPLQPIVVSFDKNTNQRETAEAAISTSHMQSIINKLELKSSSLLLNLNYVNLIPSRTAWNMSIRFLKKHRILKRTRIALLLVQASYALLRFKDPQPLSGVLKELLEKTHFSRHRTYFYFIRSLVNFFCKRFKRVYGLLGFKLKLSGKLGIGGNAKRRKKYFVFGVRTNSSKRIRREDVKTYVRTHTGVFGFFLSIFY